MSKFFGVVTLVVGGIILADILIHPTGTATAFNGAAQLAIPSINGLLGSTSRVPAAVSSRAGGG